MVSLLKDKFGGLNQVQYWEKDEWKIEGKGRKGCKTGNETREALLYV